ncbi:MAG: TAXI family TRAP transporter solute-binding subunit [Bifidobacteriaceae bacterium]|jgi:TRAP transporter TAXI family solute receptor|nr:TAXI family TRAP transporter solute-binding subunit [Bifidobacteriaceae bacterium]
MLTKPRRLLPAVALIATAALLAACTNSTNNPETDPGDGDTGTAVDRSTQFITVLTGPASGLYYPVGNAFSEVLGNAGYKTSAQETTGSSENIQGILGHEGDIAIAMSDVAVQAYNATEAFADAVPATQLRSLMGLWPNVCQIITTTQAGITSFSDLKGKRVGVGAMGSGVEANARAIFAANDMSYEDVEVAFLDYGDAVEAIKVGEMDAAFATSGLGNATIAALGETASLAFVPVEGEALARLTSEFPYYVQSQIPASAYGTAQDVTTVAVMNVLLAHEDLDDAVVTDMLELFYSVDGLTIIGDSHPTAKENIKLESGLHGIAGIDLPIHPAAAQFFADKGVTAS